MPSGMLPFGALPTQWTRCLVTSEANRRLRSLGRPPWPSHDARLPGHSMENTGPLPKPAINLQIDYVLQERKKKKHKKGLSGQRVVFVQELFKATVLYYFGRKAKWKKTSSTKKKNHTHTKTKQNKKNMHFCLLTGVNFLLLCFLWVFFFDQSIFTAGKKMEMTKRDNSCKGEPH